MMHLHGFHHLGGLAPLLILIVVLAIFFAQAEHGDGLARGLGVGALVLLVLMLCGCETVVERPDGQQPQTFCERHAQGCAVTAVTVGVVGVFAGLELAHHIVAPHSKSDHGQVSDPCVTVGCIQ